MLKLAFWSTLAALTSGRIVRELDPRPSITGYNTLQGICNPSAGAIPGESYYDDFGTLKACANRCSMLPNCRGFNYFTNLRQCQLFSTSGCVRLTPEVKASFARVDSGSVHNFYLKTQVTCALSTSGEEFYLAFMANRVTKPKNVSIEMWLTRERGARSSPVSIESDPLFNFQGSLRFPFNRAAPTRLPGTFRLKDLDRGVSIESKAVRLYSDEPFSVVGVNKERFSADAFKAFPVRLFGTHYIASCQWPPFYNCEFAVTPVDDYTTVSVTLPKATTRLLNRKTSIFGVEECALPFEGRVYTNGDTFSFTLNRFEVAQIQDLCDLTGAIIRADNQVAVWSGDSRANVGRWVTRDHLVEQLLPVDIWGKNCMAWPTPDRSSDLLDVWLITAAEDDTIIDVYSSQTSEKRYRLEAGGSIRFEAFRTSEWMHFMSDKVFQATQYSASTNGTEVAGDPSMTLCIPNSHFSFQYEFVTPKGVSGNYASFLTVIAPIGSENGFLLNNQRVTGITWTEIPNSIFYGGTIRLDPRVTFHRIRHENSGTFFGAYVFGGTDRESYAYPAGVCIRSVDSCERTFMIVADNKDNDCDGVVDEEVCDGIDNDYDSLVDEDCFMTYFVERQTTTFATRRTTRPCYRGTKNWGDSSFERMRPCRNPRWR